MASMKFISRWQLIAYIMNLRFEVGAWQKFVCFKKIDHKHVGAI